MNAYDFDNTIYDGESIVDFFKFCLKKDKKLFKYSPYIIYYLIAYKLNLLSIKKIEKTIEKLSKSFFKNNNVDYTVFIEEFWEENIHKLKPTFLKQLKEEDLIITGCPDFLINHIKDKLIAKNIVSTRFNLKTKKLEFLCFGENKVKVFKELFETQKVNKFYSDSLADIPFMHLANEVYFVNKNKIKLIDKSKYIKP